MRNLSLLLPRLLLALAAGASLAGCMAIDSVESRGKVMSDGITQYRNQVVLNNIIRSANDEPLSFTAIPNIVGRNTLQLGIPGTPGLNWAANGAFSRALGGTSNQYAATNDFTVVALDDAATYAAMLAQTDAATIANFAQLSQYSTELIYLLFISRIRVADDDGTILGAFYSDGLYRGSNLRAFLHLARLELRFNVEKGSLPGQAKKPRTQICFEERNQYQFTKGNPAIKTVWDELARENDGGEITRKGEIVRPMKKDKKGRSQPNRASYCHEDDTWLPASGGKEDGGGATNIACVAVQRKDGQPVTADCSPRKDDKDKNAADRSAYYVVYDKFSGRWLELKTRSTWGIYQQLGTLAYQMVAKNQPPLKIPRQSEYDLTILNIKKNYPGECFVEIDDNGRYCVPEEPASRYTKVIFSLLRQLIGLQSAAVNVPVSSSSVRITP